MTAKSQSTGSFHLKNRADLVSSLLKFAKENGYLRKRNQVLGDLEIRMMLSEFRAETYTKTVIGRDVSDDEIDPDDFDYLDDPLVPFLQGISVKKFKHRLTNAPEDIIDGILRYPQVETPPKRPPPPQTSSRRPSALMTSLSLVADQETSVRRKSSGLLTLEGLGMSSTSRRSSMSYSTWQTPSLNHPPSRLDESVMSVSSMIDDILGSPSRSLTPSGRIQPTIGISNSAPLNREPPSRPSIPRLRGFESASLASMNAISDDDSLVDEFRIGVFGPSGERISEETPPSSDDDHDDNEDEDEIPTIDMSYTMSGYVDEDSDYDETTTARDTYYSLALTPETSAHSAQEERSSNHLILPDLANGGFYRVSFSASVTIDSAPSMMSHLAQSRRSLTYERIAPGLLASMGAPMSAWAEE